MFQRAPPRREGPEQVIFHGIPCSWHDNCLPRAGWTPCSTVTFRSSPVPAVLLT